ncbi:topoisomerase DNA-binding C4 zinc finger domain-containing protein [Lederbergia graminis]|uniref:Topoisomerase DNA-binding C4 zinc finger domain-containing protein n=1 Tax=Lederbergia graminis TaxID=735518 RepID=A0ABW0LLP9_9BACI
MMIDFNNNYQIKKFLKRDKHKLLEGMVVEELFNRDIIQKQKWENWFSKGWWAIQDPLARLPYLLFHVSENSPTESDLEIYRLLIEKKFIIIHVKLINNNLFFLEINNQILNSGIRDNNYIHEYVFLASYRLIKNRKVHLAEKEYRNSLLQDRTIMFFEQTTVLKEVALQRYFANYFLTVNFTGYPINLDGFIIFSDYGLSVLEVKFKYPDSNNNYGINKGQAQLFTWFLENNINIAHYIAQNPSGSKEIGIFEVLASQELKSNFCWEYHILNIEELNKEDSTAPKETSIGGNKKVRFKSIPANKFIKLDQFPVSYDLDLAELPKKTCPICDSDLVARNGKYGYFMGCTNYKNHQ